MRRGLVSCQHFAISEWSVIRGAAHRFASADAAVLMMIQGGGELRWGADLDRTLGVRAGDTVLLPASLPLAELRTTHDTKLLEITPPARADGEGSPPEDESDAPRDESDAPPDESER